MTVWFLQVVASPRLPVGISFRLDGKFSYSFGRDKSTSRSHIRIPEVEVSRDHALIECLDEGVVIVDRGSLSGTFVNEYRLSPSRVVSQPILLDLGCRISIGATIFCVVDHSE